MIRPGKVPRPGMWDWGRLSKAIVMLPQCGGRCPCGSSSVLLLQTWGVGGGRRGGICTHSTRKRRPGLCAPAARASRVLSVKGVGLRGPWRDVGALRGGRRQGEPSASLSRTITDSTGPRAHTRDTYFSQIGVPAWWVPGEGPLPGWHMATFSPGSATVGRQFWFLPCLRAPIPS